MINQQKNTRRDIALLIMINKEGKFLLQHRSKHIERWPGYWGFFGGGIEAGETPEEGLRREIQEELSYIVNDPRLFAEQEYNGKSHWGKRYIYICEQDETQEFVLCSESQAYEWYHYEGLEGVKVHDVDSETLRSFNGKFL